MHLAQQRRGELGAGAAQRMTQRNGASVHIDALRVKVQRSNNGQRLRGKCLIQFD